jgi:hypothetical protein
VFAERNSASTGTGGVQSIARTGESAAWHVVARPEAQQDRHYGAAVISPEAKTFAAPTLADNQEEEQ